MSTDNLPAAPASPAPQTPVAAAGGSLDALGTIVTDPRLPELGMIRFGEQVPAKTKDGRDVMRAKPLTKPRLTSTDGELLTAAAGKLGGKVEPWTNPATGEVGFELYTEVDSLECIIPLGAGPVVHQAWEQYKGGGFRTAFSDGYVIREFTEQNVWTERPADREELDGPDWKVITRLRLVLPHVPGIGVWTLRTTSKKAAEDMPSQIKFLALLSVGRGEPVAGRLRLKQRIDRRLVDGEGPKTRRVNYPVLDITDKTPAEMLEARDAQIRQLEAEARQQDPRQIMAGSTQTPAGATIFPNGIVGEVEDPGPGPDQDPGAARREAIAKLVGEHKIKRDPLYEAIRAQGVEGFPKTALANLESGEQTFRTVVLAIGAIAAAADAEPAEDAEGEVVDEGDGDPPLPPESATTASTAVAYTDPDDPPAGSDADPNQERMDT